MSPADLERAQNAAEEEQQKQTESQPNGLPDSSPSTASLSTTPTETNNNTTPGESNEESPSHSKGEAVMTPNELGIAKITPTPAKPKGGKVDQKPHTVDPDQTKQPLSPTQSTPPKLKDSPLENGELSKSQDKDTLTPSETSPDASGTVEEELTPASTRGRSKAAVEGVLFMGDSHASRLSSCGAYKSSFTEPKNLAKGGQKTHELVDIIQSNGPTIQKYRHCVVSIGANDCKDSSSAEITCLIRRAASSLKKLNIKIHLIAIPPRHASTNSKTWKPNERIIKVTAEVNAELYEMAKNGEIDSLIEPNIDPRKANLYSTKDNGNLDSIHFSNHTADTLIVPEILKAIAK
jgi:hypothetical protein